jgi:hypothetical protein
VCYFHSRVSGVFAQILFMSDVIGSKNCERKKPVTLTNSTSSHRRINEPYVQEERADWLSSLAPDVHFFGQKSWSDLPHAPIHSLLLYQWKKKKRLSWWSKCTNRGTTSYLLVVVPVLRFNLVRHRCLLSPRYASSSTKRYHPLLHPTSFPYSISQLNEFAAGWGSGAKEY